MNSLFTKSTIYDVLAVIVPGAMIIGAVLRWWIGISTTQDFDLFLWTLIFVLTLLVGLLNNAISEELSRPLLRNNPKKIFKQYKKLLTDFSLDDTILAINGVETDQDLALCLNEYYRSYYHAIKSGMGAIISILECHVAFLRNIILPLIIVLLLFFSGSCHCECMWVCILTLASLPFLLMWSSSIQDKIYYSIWECRHFTHSSDNQRF